MERNPRRPCSHVGVCFAASIQDLVQYRHHSSLVFIQKASGFVLKNTLVFGCAGITQEHRRLMVRATFNIVDRHGGRLPAIAAMGFGMYQLQNDKFLEAVQTDDPGLLPAIHRAHEMAVGHLLFAAVADSTQNTGCFHGGIVARFILARKWERDESPTFARV